MHRVESFQSSRRSRPVPRFVVTALLGGVGALGCSTSDDGTASGTGGQTTAGGQTASGGASTPGLGGTTSGGAITSGGAASGGTTSSSGMATGGALTSGGSGAGGSSPSGGSPSGGSASGGASGGAATAGGNAGSATSGGATVGGSAGGAGKNAGGANNGGSSSTGGAAGGGGKAGGANAGSAGAGGSGGGGDIVPPAGYKLVWHDEFDVDGAPNPANWKFEKGFVRNEEAQWYQSDNASVKGGFLVIEARKERVTNPGYTGSGDWKTTRQYAEYTSASLNTNGLQTFQYGRFEMRARIPTAAGMWPAWWTLGVSGEWPANGEVDIMEFYQAKVLANVACGTSTRWQAKWDSVTKALSSLGASWPSEFHVWRMDWDDQNIDIYMDGQVMNNTPLSSMLNADGTSPFKQKEYILVNVALGGVNGGSPGSTTFPQRLEVDYIRVFQK